MIIKASHKVAIAGTIKDEFTEQPIADTIVNIVGQNFNIWATENGSFYLIGEPKSPIKLPTSLAKIENGFFNFMDLPDGEYKLKVSAPNFKLRYEQDKEIDVTAPNLQISVELSPTQLTGNVRRSDNQEPISQALVKLGGSEYQTFTDIEGKYTLSDIVASSPTIQVSHKSFELSTRKLEQQLNPGEKRTEDFSLKPLNSI
ncbi:carboxypeptidase regulatory-like domain-containing protein [Mastigocoleus sp. MO_188.B34]|uniref:carboxypeptidase regulatory-like domain-containing protein n=1 Tax=Mastigocoleus sp. MO_188.B34 TaxID=3036635 RepID=UPI002609F248|nr:carboxypeptidase-like regulatory domain-containing protein [Mastigocoleus sp. MO_188.B34]MDJ0693216.1 carboxypeptidase-like regulatory domain-containing protein [Mastigocoleus sp. MO_188.B34]